MSRASKLTLAATGLGTAGIVYFVHWAQENDRAACSSLLFGSNSLLLCVQCANICCLQAMHKGVERDMEKQRARQERQAEFEMQKRLEEEYLKLQTVSPSTGDPNSASKSQNTGT